LPLGVGVIFLHCMTSSLFHSHEHPSFPRRRWPGPQSGIPCISPNTARGQCRLPIHHNITNLCKSQLTTNIFIIESDPTYASALLRPIRPKFIVDRLHRAGCSR
jgi:hypothetical protein